MNDLAKIFINGRSQAVRLPAAYRFDSKEVYIHRDPETGDVILSAKPENWNGFLLALKGTPVPTDFLGSEERARMSQDRDPFQGWKE
ncbi:MAG TPA: AbrB/MazE/SpoVT family DNA-binding domain-containing protein [Gammaproteobacteria bacterium]|nr:AbrB/MazE/SpoVT family DNA-binding domain-containing protein [Gammaproteobacteria bacterium]